MTFAWIIMSTRWDFANVQATLNVIISVLGTIGIWAFSRFWYQRGSTKIISKTNAPLSALFTFTSPGEAWDLLILLKGHIFESRYFHLLVQLVAILIVTTSTTLAGPIARYALRAGHMVQQNTIAGLSASKGGGAAGNSASASVLWNNTFQNMDEANFPYDQLLDFLPPSTISWTYRAEEWDPAWRVQYNNTEETPLNITANPNYPIVDPLNAFPEFRDTFDRLWFNKSVYRVTADFCGWFPWVSNYSLLLAKDVVVFVLIQSDPAVDDQMNKNQYPIHLSLSTIQLHLSTRVMRDGQVNYSARTAWALNGTVGNASYVRTECTITRKAVVADEDKIPWPWTNDTVSWSINSIFLLLRSLISYTLSPFTIIHNQILTASLDSLIKAFADYNRFAMIEASVRNETVPLFNSSELFRFYQVYQVATSTGWQVPGIKFLSLNYTTVELSTAFLVVILLLVVFIIVGSIRYTWFYHRNKETLETLFVLDGTIDWMLWAAKAARTDIEVGVKDRVHFQKATFGRQPSTTPIYRLARVHSGVALSDMKPSRCSIGRTSVKTGAVVTVNEIPDSSSSRSSSANSDEKGNRAAITFAQPQYNARPSVELQSDGRSSQSTVDPLNFTNEKAEEKSLDEKAI